MNNELKELVEAIAEYTSFTKPIYDDNGDYTGEELKTITELVADLRDAKERSIAQYKTLMEATDKVKTEGKVTYADSIKDSQVSGVIILDKPGAVVMNNMITGHVTNNPNPDEEAGVTAASEV